MHVIFWQPDAGSSRQIYPPLVRVGGSARESGSFTRTGRKPPRRAGTRCLIDRNHPRGKEGRGPHALEKWESQVPAVPAGASLLQFLCRTRCRSLFPPPPPIHRASALPAPPSPNEPTAPISTASFRTVGCLAQHARIAVPVILQFTRGILYPIRRVFSPPISAILGVL